MRKEEKRARMMSEKIPFHTTGSSGSLIELQLRETIVIFVRGSGCVLKLPKRE
jgi:hypothetical protein